MERPRDIGLGTTLGEVCVRQAVTVSEHDTLAFVARVIAENRAFSALIAEPPLRVVTERDLALAWSHGRRPDDEVADIVSGRARWALDTTRVMEAAGMMIDLGIRHLVVVDRHDEPIGVVAMPELLAALLSAQDPTTIYASFAVALLR